MRKAIYAFSFLFTLLFALDPDIITAGEEMPEEPVITVSGSAEDEFMPDTAIVNIAVETAAKTVKESLALNNVRTERVISALKKALGEGDSVKTSSFNVSPVYEYDGTSKRNVLTGYRVVNRVFVRTKRVKDAGGLVDVSVEAGANSVDDLHFLISDYAPLCEGLLKKASARTLKEADVVTAAFGVKAKGVKEITPSCPSGGEMPVYRFAMEKASKGVATPIEAGTLKVEANVTAVFYIGE